jgi:hypothetical protein
VFQGADFLQSSRQELEEAAQECFHLKALKVGRLVVTVASRYQDPGVGGGLLKLNCPNCPNLRREDRALSQDLWHWNNMTAEDLLTRPSQVAAGGVQELELSADSLFDSSVEKVLFGCQVAH